MLWTVTCFIHKYVAWCALPLKTWLTKFPSCKDFCFQVHFFSTNRIILSHFVMRKASPGAWFQFSQDWWKAAYISKRTCQVDKDIQKPEETFMDIMIICGIYCTVGHYKFARLPFHQFVHTMFHSQLKLAMNIYFLSQWTRNQQTEC